MSVLPVHATINYWTDDVGPEIVRLENIYTLVPLEFRSIIIY